MKARRIVQISMAVVVLGAGGVGLSAALQQFHRSSRETPTTRVQRGSVDIKVYTTGELRPSQTSMLVAPPVGGTLQIVRLAKTGTRVNSGDPVVEFDPSEQEYNLEQSRSELAQAEEEITKAKADAAVKAAEDQVALLKARFDVRRAELEVSRNELVSAIDAKRNLLALDEAKRQRVQLEQDVRSRQASNQATLAVNEEKRNKARLDMQQAQKNIENMQLHAPIAGLVVVKENPDAAGGFFYSGMVLPEFREGDLVSPGRLVAQVLDIEKMEIQSKISETDRANLNTGEAVEVQVDALPGPTFSGKVKNVAGMASRNFWEADAVRKFDATFLLDKPDPRLRPGFTVQVVVSVEQLKNALYLPRQAVFEKDGKPVVYVKSGSAFTAKEVKVDRRTESKVVVEGLSEGAEVALVSPEEQVGSPKKTSAPPGPTVTGGGR